MYTYVYRYRIRARRFFFFQAGDGIRDGHVTGVQTCALPILYPPSPLSLTGCRIPIQGWRSRPTSRRRETNLPASIVGRNDSASPWRPAAKFFPPIAITDRVVRPNGLGSSAEDRSGESRRRPAHEPVAMTRRSFIGACILHAKDRMETRKIG